MRGVPYFLAACREKALSGIRGAVGLAVQTCDVTAGFRKKQRAGRMIPRLGPPEKREVLLASGKGGIFVASAFHAGQDLAE